MTVPKEPSWGEIIKAAVGNGGLAGGVVGGLVAGFVMIVGKTMRTAAQEAEREKNRVRWTDEARWDRRP